MARLDAVDLSFFENAPHLARRQAHLRAPRASVFEAVATDPAGWGRWFPGFSTDGHWQSPPPHAVGSVRRVRAFRVRFVETILAWDEAQRWAFRVDEVSGPFFAAFAEDYRFADDGPGTLLSWTVAFRARGAMRLSAPLVPLGLGPIISRAGAGLDRMLLPGG